MIKWRTQQVSLLAFFPCFICLAQAPARIADPASSNSPVVGTWHNMTKPQFPQGVLLISEDGYFSQITISPSRTKPVHDFDHRTKAELAKQFGGFRASYGTWKIVGSKLVRTLIASEEPGSEGMETAQDFRFEGEILLLGGPQHETRFRRMK
jgi:hypothetical protein